MITIIKLWPNVLPCIMCQWPKVMWPNVLIPIWPPRCFHLLHVTVSKLTRRAREDTSRSPAPPAVFRLSPLSPTLTDRQCAWTWLRDTVIILSRERPSSIRRLVMREWSDRRESMLNVNLPLAPSLTETKPRETPTPYLYRVWGCSSKHRPHIYPVGFFVEQL